MVDRKLEEGFRRAGKKLDMGKSCVRFRTLDDLPLEVIGDSIAGLPPARYIAQCRAALAGATRSGTTRARPTRSGTKSAAKKAKG